MVIGRLELAPVGRFLYSRRAADIRRSPSASTDSPGGGIVKALFKTLFGDRANIAFVAIVLALEFLFVHSGLAAAAGFAIPIVILAGVSWQATR